MATVSTENRTIEVTLYRTGADLQVFTMPEGASLADLLRAAGVPPRDSSLLINGRSIESILTLESGMTITILPEPPGLHIRSWRDTVGMFADNPFFEEAVAEGRAIREADRRAAREEAAREDS